MKFIQRSSVAAGQRPAAVLLSTAALLASAAVVGACSDTPRFISSSAVDSYSWIASPVDMLSYCEASIQCLGGNDQDLEVCVLDSHQTSTLASISGCLTHYSDYQQCLIDRQADAVCDNGLKYPDQCNDLFTSWFLCQSGAEAPHGKEPSAHSSVMETCDKVGECTNSQLEEWLCRVSRQFQLLHAEVYGCDAEDYAECVADDNACKDNKLESGPTCADPLATLNACVSAASNLE